MESFEDRVAGNIERSIYVLKCEDDYYYVGESSTQYLDRRFLQQQGIKVGKCPQSKFCKLHHPIEMIFHVDLGPCEYKEAEIIENAFTKFYVSKYGKDKVSGGVACLTDNALKEISSDTAKEILSKIEL